MRSVILLVHVMYLRLNWVYLNVEVIWFLAPVRR
jgi:hypothetical protein